jgi:hypothetical protein
MTGFTGQKVLHLSIISPEVARVFRWFSILQVARCFYLVATQALVRSLPNVSFNIFLAHFNDLWRYNYTLPELSTSLTGTSSTASITNTASSVMTTVIRSTSQTTSPVATTRTTSQLATATISPLAQSSTTIYRSAIETTSPVASTQSADKLQYQSRSFMISSVATSIVARHTDTLSTTSMVDARKDLALKSTTLQPHNVHTSWQDDSSMMIPIETQEAIKDEMPTQTSDQLAIEPATLFSLSITTEVSAIQSSSKITGNLTNQLSFGAVLFSYYRRYAGLVSLAALSFIMLFFTVLFKIAVRCILRQQLKIRK